MKSAGLLFFLILVGFVLFATTTRFLSDQPRQPQSQVSVKTSVPVDSPEVEPELISTTESLKIGHLKEENSVLPAETDPGGLLLPRTGVPVFDSPVARKLQSRDVFGDIRQVEIPSMKLSTDVVLTPFEDSTWDVSTLGQNLARLEGMQGPLENNLVLAGHVTLRDGTNGPLRYLSSLRIGDPIRIYTNDRVFIFTVSEMIVVFPDEIEVTADTQFPQLTLITCATWDQETLSYLRRQVVLAVLEKVELNSVMNVID
jgi:LPXTG-site transpeptidase (sortase) family protein